MRLLPLLLLLHALADAIDCNGVGCRLSSASVFVHGAICRESDPLASAFDVIAGKHLRVIDFDWPPYAYRDLDDPDLPTGWGGFDIDLMDFIAGKIGITYEVVAAEELDYSPHTYATLSANDQLAMSLPQGDLMLSYWSRTPERLAHPNVSMVYGHIDTSKVLLAQSISAPEVPFSRRVLSFLRPFTLSLWGCLIAMVLASGVVDYLLEIPREAELDAQITTAGDAEGKSGRPAGVSADSGDGFVGQKLRVCRRVVHQKALTESIYEYCAGTLW